MATIRKRGAYQWEAQIRKRGFPPQSKTFNTKSEAEAWSRHVESEMTRGIWLPSSEADRTTLNEALERYWREVSSQRLDPSRERYIISAWQKHPFSVRFLANLRGVDFARYRDERRTAGKAENTIRIELALISHLYEIARKEWGMESLANPVKNIRKPSTSRERDRRLTHEEYNLLLTELGQCGNPWVRAAFELAIETSMRQGMLFKLRWAWIDLDRRLVSIPATYQTVANKGVPSILPLSTKAVAILRSLPHSIDGRVLGCSQNAAVCAWKRVIKRLNIKNLRWHDLRHEAVSRLFEKGLHPLEVASISGHRSMQMLKRYTHLRPESLLNKLG